MMAPDSQRRSRRWNERVETGVWYWMDAGPAEEWEPDVRRMAELGYDYTVACWGRRATDLATRPAETQRFLDLCGKRRLGVYLCCWSSLVMYPRLGAQGFCVDDKGLARPVYNLAQASWRNGPYRDYLQRVARLYRGRPALRGYRFDDTFSLRNAEGVADVSQQGRFVSYSEEDKRAFRDWLRDKYKRLEVLCRFCGIPENDRVSDWGGIEPPRDPNGPLWSDWRQARSDWIEDWARDTRAFLSEVDPDAEACLLDGSRSAISLTDTAGVDLSRVARHFDALTLYAMPFGLRSEPVDMGPILATLECLVQRARKVAGRAGVGACFHIWQRHRDDPPNELVTWPYPTIEQIRRMTLCAALGGADRIEHYGYRIGDWGRIDRESDAPIPEIANMLRGRRDLWEGIRELNTEIKGGSPPPSQALA